MLYLLNSPVLTSYGSYRFQGPLDSGQVSVLLRQEFVSAIGHAAAAEFLTVILGRTVPVQRISIEMQRGDEALVLRLKTRFPEGKILTPQEMQTVDYELGWLQRVD